MMAIPRIAAAPAALTLTCALLLAACSARAPSAVSDQDIVDADGAQNVLTDSSGYVTVSLPASFSAGSPLGAEADSVTLFASDPAQGVSFYVSDTGELKTSALDYFAKIKSHLESSKPSQFAEVKVDQPVGDRLVYRLSHELDGFTIRESCAAMVAGAHAVTACAFGPGKDFADLDILLAKTKLNNPPQPPQKADAPAPGGNGGGPAPDALPGEADPAANGPNPPPAESDAEEQESGANEADGANDNRPDSNPDNP